MVRPLTACFVVSSEGLEIGNTSRTYSISIVQKALAYEGKGLRLSQKMANGSRKGLPRFFRTSPNAPDNNR